MHEQLSIETFRARTGIGMECLGPLFGDVSAVVSLRDMKTVQQVLVMPRPFLKRLLSAVVLMGDRKVHPYAGCKFSRVRMDPRMLLVGQTFIENRKILELGKFESKFEGHDVPFGISKKGSYVVFGRTTEGIPAIALYIPPIVEWTGGYHHLLDGVHRCFHTKTSGTTIEVLKIHHVHTPLPYEAAKWRDVREVDEKPPKHERFHQLQPDLFRDLKYVGIDG